MNLLQKLYTYLERDKFFLFWKKMLTANDLEELRQLYNLVDSDGSDAISKEEFAQLLKSVNIDLKPVEFTAVIRDIDKDQSGAIEFSEFAKVMANDVNPLKLQAHQVSELFSRFAAKDAPLGFIRVSDLERTIVEQSQGTVDPLEIHELMDSFKLSIVEMQVPGTRIKDFYFNYAEYIDMLRGNSTTAEKIL